MSALILGPWKYYAGTPEFWDRFEWKSEDLFNWVASISKSKEDIYLWKVHLKDIQKGGAATTLKQAMNECDIFLLKHGCRFLDEKWNILK